MRLSAMAALRWTTLTALSHLAWELLQLPLYTLWDPHAPTPAIIAAIHCTGGDVLISLGVLGVVGVAVRDLTWPWRTVGRAHALALILGIAYTAVSEWNNVYVTGAWAYATGMPRWFGIGVAPLLQWAVVPPFTWWWLRRYP